MCVFGVCKSVLRSAFWINRAFVSRSGTGFRRPCTVRWEVSPTPTITNCNSKTHPRCCSPNYYSVGLARGGILHVASVRATSTRSYAYSGWQLRTLRTMFPAIVTARIPPVYRKGPRSLRIPQPAPKVRPHVDQRRPGVSASGQLRLASGQIYRDPCGCRLCPLWWVQDTSQPLCYLTFAL